MDGTTAPGGLSGTELPGTELPGTELFDTVLVANRGEIAVRVIRTLRRLGIRSAAVYSDADARARHVAEADIAVRLGPAPARLSYLDGEAVIAAARRAGARAVHPGYGFLAENPRFARSCADAGLVFIGPPAAVIEAMGDKIRAKRTAQAAGVPVVPGRHDPAMSDADLISAAAEIGFPVLLKPSAGGGGTGMLRVDAPELLPEAIVSARRLAAAAFGDDTLFVERRISAPRHIEVQILADAHGGVVHLGERECSLQRRHQKIVEEAPSVLLDGRHRDRIGEAAVRIAVACGYVGAGTVEFLVDGRHPDDYFFLEMNTRLQVEHPVTELVTGLDLVEEQLRCAAGEPLRFGQDGVVLSGHAVEARVYAEDPARGFLPTGGRVLTLREPEGEGVRVDGGLSPGTVVGSDYDPMLAKVIVWAPDRTGALARLGTALAGTVILGVTTNLGFLRRLLTDPEVVAGRLDTELVTRRAAEQVRTGVSREAVAAAALGRLAERGPGPGAQPFDVPSGWRLGADPAWTHDRLQASEGPTVDDRVHASEGLTVDVRVRGRADRAQVQVGEEEPQPATVTLDDDGRLTVAVAGSVRHWWYARDGETRWVGADGETWALRRIPARARPEDDTGDEYGALLAPMPGTVTAVHVAEGDTVTAGQAVVTVEAMKMEHVVRARGNGVVRALLVAAGRPVALAAELAVITGPEPGR